MDATRISYLSDSDKTLRVDPKGMGDCNKGCGATLPGHKKNWQEWPPSEGRWPANTILTHLESCVCLGSKKVKPANGSGIALIGNSTAGSQIFGGGIGGIGLRSLPDVSHLSKEGTETVLSWNCAEGCPVADMDAKSFAMGMHSAGNQKVAKHTKGNQVYSGELKPFDHNPDYYADKGGASRFFKQTQRIGK